MNARFYLWICLVLGATIWTSAAAAESVPKLFQASYALESAYKYDQALAKVQTIPAQGIDTYMVHLRRGWLLYLLGRYVESSAAYQQAIAADGDAIEAHLGATLPLMALRRWTDAERHCRATLNSAPGSYRGQSRLAYILYSAGRYGESQTVYTALVRRYPSDVEMRAGLGWALLKQEHKTLARAAFEMVLRYSSEHHSATEGVAATK